MIRRLDEANLDAFLDYCRRNRDGLDRSYLSDAELKKFTIGPSSPTFIALDESMRITGAASLIIDEASLKARRARLRILHSEIEGPGMYNALLEGLIKETPGIDSLYIFSPDGNLSLLSNLKGLGFATDRLVFVFVREDEAKPEVSLPNGFSLRQYIKGFDEQAWCDIRNTAFANLKGNETPITTDMVREMAAGVDHIDGGMLFLTEGDNPVGLVRGSKDEFNGRAVMNIGPLAVLPSYQGRGLGRILLRAMLQCAHEKSYSSVILSVNADNESALSLYTQEGFRKVEGFACLNLKVQDY